MVRIEVVALVALMACAHGGVHPDESQDDDGKKFFRLSSLKLDTGAQPSVAGARTVDPRLYQASFFSRDLKCTSSLVGPRVLLTAAHCVTDGGRIAIEVGLNERKVTGACTWGPGYHPKQNISPDYALCLTTSDVVETPYFETVNIDATRLSSGIEVLLTGFGCTKKGGGGDTSGKVYRVGEAKVFTLPAGSEDRFVVKGGATICFGDSGGPAFLQRGKDGGPRIQLSVNAIGTDGDKSALASLSTPTAIAFLTDWSVERGVTICGVPPAKNQKCVKFN